MESMLFYLLKVKVCTYPAQDTIKELITIKSLKLQYKKETNPEQNSTKHGPEQEFLNINFKVDSAHRMPDGSTHNY